MLELVFILDRSGSMSGKEEDTIGGFNSLVEKQRKEEGDAIVTVILFDDQYEVLYDRVPLKDVPVMTSKEYYVRGSTALLDAVGKTINHVKALQDGSEEGSRPGKTLFVIVTDGMENASKEYRQPVVKNLIETRKKDGWDFLFIGANIDSVSEAAKIGIDASCAANYECSEAGSARMFSAVGKVVSHARKGGSAPLSESIPKDWKDEM